MKIKKIIKLKSISTIAIFSAALITLSGNIFALDGDTDGTTSSGYNTPTGVYFGINTLIVSWGAVLGDMFTPHFGLEAGASTSWLLFGTDAIYYLSAKGVLPMGERGQFFAKLGVGAVNSTMLFNSNTARVGPTYGIGFGYSFSRKWLGSIELNGIYAGLSGDSHSQFISMPTVGLSYYFTT